MHWSSWPRVNLLGLTVLERLSSATVLDRLELRGLLEVRMDGLRTEVWLAHPLHGEALRAEDVAATPPRPFWRCWPMRSSKPVPADEVTSFVSRDGGWKPASRAMPRA